MKKNILLLLPVMIAVNSYSQSPQLQAKNHLPHHTKFQLKKIGPSQGLPYHLISG